MRFLLWLLILNCFVFCLSVAPKEITVGDPIFIRSKEKVIISPPFELWDIEREGDTFIYRGSIYIPGVYILKIKTSKREERVRVSVVSVLKGGEELQDIEGVKEVVGSPRRLLKAISILAGALLVFFVAKILRKSLLRLLFPRRLSQEEILRRRLDKAINYAKKGMWVDFYSETSRAVREFLYYKLAVPALSLTLMEMKTEFRGATALEEVINLLELADRKRFSMEISDLQEADDFIRKVKEFFLKR